MSDDLDDLPPVQGSTAAPGPGDDRARLVTRWIGTGIGAVLLATVIVLVFARACINSAQSHVMAVVLALGAAVVLWGVVGGLKVDLKLKFKALGEVTAAGVAAIFLIVHFVSADGIITPDECPDPEATTDDHIQVLYGRVFQHGSETKPVAGAEVKVEMQKIETRFTDADGQFDIIVKGEVPQIRVWVQKDGFYESVPVDESVPLGKDKIRIPLVKLILSDPRPPRIEDFPTFVEDWEDPLVKGTDADFERAQDKVRGDPLEAINWARRAHALGKWNETVGFFELAKTADPEGRSWFTDQPYLASAYREMGREQDAAAVRNVVEEAKRVGDPRLDPSWYRVMTQDFDLLSARALGDVGVGVYDPRVVFPTDPRFPAIDPTSSPTPMPTPTPTPTPTEPVPTTEPVASPQDPRVFDSPIKPSGSFELENKARLDPTLNESTAIRK